MTAGITNAKIISGGSGIGDTVYAINQTGKELKYGDKVWINKHNYDRYDAMSYYAGGAKTLDMFPYCFNNGDIVRLNGENVEWLYYDSDNKTWTSQTYAYSSSKTQSYLTRIEKMGNAFVKKDTMSMSTSADEWFIFKTKMVNMDGKILRDNLLFKYAGTSKKYNLIEIVNSETGELGQTYSTITATGSTLSSVEVSGNVLLIIDSSNNYTIYNISDLANPTTLVTGKLVVDCVRCLTGLNVGDYVFMRAEPDSYLVASGVTSILKVAADYTLVTADDLPSEFYEYMADSSTTFFYNNENKTLTVGNSTSVNLYKWENGVFNKLSYSIPLPTDYELYSGYGYMLFTSDDLSTASIGARRTSGSSSYYGGANVYKMINDNDEWYAEDYIHANPITVTGIATGNTDDEGRVEVELSVYCEESEDTGGGASSKFGITADSIVGTVDENGVLQPFSGEKGFDIIFNGVKDIAENGLNNSFAYYRSIKSVSFPDLQEISNKTACKLAFNYAPNIKSVDLSKLKTISGDNACESMFEIANGITSVDLSGLETVSGKYACQDMFYYDKAITSINLSSLKYITNEYACQNMFYGCTGITSVDLSNLEIINGYSGTSDMFRECTGITSVNLSKLKTIKGNGSGASGMFWGCTSLVSADLSSLEEIGNYSFGSFFRNCSSLPSVYFPSLIKVSTMSLDIAFTDCTALTEIHFRADMQSTIEGLTGYSSKFGATNATIYFDL